MSATIRTRTANAGLSWLLAATLAVLALWTAVAGSILWSGVIVVSLGIVLAPPLVTRDPTVMPHWGVVALLVIPLVGRAVGSFRPVFVYVVLAALSLLVAVEIDAYSTATFTPWFAVTFVVFVTMAAAGLWAIAQFTADTVLGTTYLTTRTDLMWDLVTATAVGFGAGVLFGFTVLRRSTDEPRPVSTG